MGNCGVTSQQEFEVPAMNNMLTHAAATPPEDSTTRLIPLTQGKFAIVDAADYEWLNQWKWQAKCDKKRNLWYAERSLYFPETQKQTSILMHRVLINAQRGVEVDHRDRNGLNNQRSNIRACTPQQNQFNRGPQKNNTSGYKGVSWDKSRNKWKANITLRGKTINLGLFIIITDAAKAYAEAAKWLHGEFFRS